jgi:hypothetical protein
MEPVIQYILVALLTLTLVYIAYRIWPRAQVQIDRTLDAGGIAAFNEELKRIGEYDAQILALQTARAAAVTRFKASQAAVTGLTVS